MVLSPPQIACLRDCEVAPLSLQMRWAGQNGDRRCRCAYGRLGGSWQEVKTVVSLVHLGLLEGADDECELIQPTPAGRAWLTAHPPPAPHLVAK